jgi:hypothetical protein
MTERLEKSRSSRSVDVRTHFLERARYYRFQAAMTENPREIERFCEVALMFEGMARDTRRFELCSRSTAKTWPRRVWPSTAAGGGGFAGTWIGRFVRLRGSIR